MKFMRKLLSGPLTSTLPSVRPEDRMEMLSTIQRSRLRMVRQFSLQQLRLDTSAY